MNTPSSTSHTTDRAVIPVVGQVILTTLIFAAVIGAASLALPEVTDQQQDIQQEIASDMLVNIDERLGVVHKTPQPENFTQTAPRGTLQLGGTQTNITITEAATGDTITASSSVIQYGTGDKEITYEAGLTTTSAQTESRFITVPDQSTLTQPTGDTIYTFQLREVDFNTTQRLDQGTTYDLELSAQRDGPARTASFDPTATGDVAVSVETKYTAGWERYLTNHPAFENVAISGDTVTADVTSTANLRVTVYPVRIRTT